jgi:hypothetical protein
VQRAIAPNPVRAKPIVEELKRIFVEFFEVFEAENMVGSGQVCMHKMRIVMCG